MRLVGITPILRLFLSIVFILIISGNVLADLNGQKTPIVYYPASMDKETQDRLTLGVNSLLNSAVNHLRNGEIKKAMEELFGAKKLSPNDQRAYDGLAKIFEKSGQYTQLYKLFEQATRYYVNVDMFLPKLIKEYLKSPVYVHSTEDVYIALFKDGKKSAYSFMFDDGERNVATHIIPIFKEYGLTGTVPINPGVTKYGNENPWRGSWEQWIAAANDGFEIANHTWSHQLIVGVESEVLDEQIGKSYQLINKEIGFSPKSFVFPLNESDKNSIAYARRKHFALRQADVIAEIHEHTFMPIYGGPFFNKDTANLIADWSIHQGMWIIPVCHGMVVKEIKKSYKPVTEDFLRKHLTYLNQHKHEIWVATFLDVYSYLYARKNAQLKVVSESKSGKVLELRRPASIKQIDVPITLVINPRKNISQGKAVTIKLKEELPVKIRNGIMYIDVPFENLDIKVSWK